MIGRVRELGILVDALDAARSGKGSAWLLEGPAGIGKTRLARGVEDRARKGGFRALSGYCLKEVLTPFFAFQQVFRGAGPEGAEGPRELPAPLPSVILIEENRPAILYHHLPSLSKDRPTLVAGRERPSAVRQQASALDPSTTLLWLARGEGEDRVSPLELDLLGERLSAHFTRAPRAVVALSGLEYLTSQTSFPAVLRLLQYLREAAEEHEGHLVISLNPDAFDKREVVLLEGEAMVLKGSRAGSARDPSPVPPAVTMMGYLDSLEEAAPRQPQLIVVDDLQWADPETLRTFQFLARNLRNLPVVLLGTVRIEEARPVKEERDGTMEEVFDSMERNGSAHRLALSGLSAPEAEALAQDLYGGTPDLSEDGGAFLQVFQRSAGNPFFLQEILRQLASEGHLRKVGKWLIVDDAGGVLERREGPTRSVIPETLVRLTSRRIEGLPRDDQELLRWAAILGREFDLAPLVSALSKSSSTLHGSLEVLERSHHLVERSARTGLDRWSFVHPILWEVVLESTPPELLRTRALHLADWWAEHRPSDVETISRLYHQALASAQGPAWVRRAIAQAMAAHAPETVERYHRWLQELLELADVGRDERVREGLGVVLELTRELGPSPSQFRILQGLLALDPSDLLRWDIQSRSIGILVVSDSRKAAQAMSELDRALEGPWHGLPRDLRVRVWIARSSFKASRGDWLGSFEAAQQAMDLLEPPRDSWSWAVVNYRGGWALWRLGRQQEAQVWCSRLGEVAHGPEGSGPLRRLWGGLSAALALSSGDLVTKQRGNESCLAEDRHSGDLFGCMNSLLNLSSVLDTRGDLQACHQAIDEAFRLAQRLDVQTVVAVAHLARGKVLLHEGHVSEARAELEEALAYCHEQGYREIESAVRIDLGEALLVSGEAGQALKELEHRSELGSISPDEMHRPALIAAWSQRVLGQSREAEASLLDAEKTASLSGNRLAEAQVRAARADWERDQGEAEHARVLRAEADRLFDQCGILPEGWIRHWPPERQLPSPPVPR